MLTSRAALKSIKQPDAWGVILVIKMLRIVRAPRPIKTPMSKVKLAS